jgi:hypothetical protein
LRWRAERSRSRPDLEISAFQFEGHSGSSKRVRLQAGRHAFGEIP